MSSLCDAQNYWRHNVIMLLCFYSQFLKPRSRDKKLQEEWAVPLQTVEDIHEVNFLSVLLAKTIVRMIIILTLVGLIRH